jgi:hypothetical protein
MPDEVADQLERLAVRPVQVVEHQHEGLALGEPGEQLAERPVGAVALGVDAGGGSSPSRRQRRQRHGQVCAEAACDPRELRFGQARQVVVERRRGHSVRDAGLPLRAAAGEDQVATRIRPSCQLAQEAALPEAERAGDG